MRHISALTALSLFIGSGLVTGPVEAKTVRVNCDMGDTIADALSKTFPGKPLIINIEGVCNENVTIGRSGVTLRGDTPATSKIDGVPEVDPIKESPITVIGAVEVVIENLTVRDGGSSAIAVVNSRVDIRNCVVEDSATSGIGVGIFVGAGGLVTIDGVTVQDNNNGGVLASRGGSAIVINSTIEDNLGFGIAVSSSANARIGIDILGNSGPSWIQNNTGDGIRISESGSGIIRNSTVTGNEGYGIQLFRSASAFMENNTISGNSPTVDTNFEGGVGIFQGSAATLVDNQININLNGYGVFLADNSQVRMTGNTVNGNGTSVEFGAGVAAYRNSTVRMAGGNTVSNSGWAAVDIEMMSVFRASGGGGETLTQAIGNTGFGNKRFVIEAFNKALVDLRSGTTATGDIEVGPLSTFRSRSNTVTGDIDVFGSSGVGLRNSVTYTGSIACGGNSFTFSNNGGPYNCNTGPHP